VHIGRKQVDVENSKIDRGRPTLSLLMFLSSCASDKRRLHIPFCVLDRMFYITMQIFHQYALLLFTVAD